MNQLTDTDYVEVEQAVDAAKQVVRGQLVQLHAEQERLTGLLEPVMHIEGPGAVA